MSAAARCLAAFQVAAQNLNARSVRLLYGGTFSCQPDISRPDELNIAERSGSLKG